MVGPIMNLISETHHSCERREYAFMILRKYTVISPSEEREEEKEGSNCGNEEHGV